MDDPAYHPVLIHCSHGCGRTGVFTAIYRMEYQGWSNRDALNEARRKSGSLPGNKGFRDDNRKAKFLLAYQPRAVRHARQPSQPGDAQPASD
jgi:protein-tyrosine phosphatase